MRRGEIEMKEDRDDTFDPVSQMEFIQCDHIPPGSDSGPAFRFRIGKHRQIVLCVQCWIRLKMAVFDWYFDRITHSISNIRIIK